MLPIPRTLPAPRASRPTPQRTPNPLPHPNLPTNNLNPLSPLTTNPRRPPPPPRLPHGIPPHPRRNPRPGTTHHPRQTHLPSRLPPSTPRRARKRSTVHAPPPRGRVPGPRSLEARTLARRERGAESGDGAVVLGVWERGQDVHWE